MPALTVRFADGRTETHELSRTAPVSIGSLEFNDICVAEVDVAPLHCRISWNKTGYEAVAASPSGIDLNGTVIQNGLLKGDDVLRIGTVDVIFIAESAADAAPVAKRKPAAVAPMKAAAAPPDPNEMSLFSGELISESLAEMEENEFGSQSDWDPADSAQRRPLRGLIEEESPAARLERLLKPSLVDRLGGRAARPGERDATRSPLILGLSALGVFLLFLSGIIWFFMARESAQRLYDQGIAEFNGGRYTQAIEVLEDFVKKHPRNSLAETAEITRDRARIQRELSGATPAWGRGLEELEKFIAIHRDAPKFRDLHTDIRGYAEQIAAGSAATAEAAREPALLEISASAAKLVDRYADPQNPPVAAQERIRVAQLKANSAIHKQQAFDLAIKQMEQFIAQRDPVNALAERRRLILRYPDLIPQKRLQECMQQALGLERDVIKLDETDRPAETTERPEPSQRAITLVAVTRSRSDEVSQGRIVLTLTSDSLLAIDSVTGDPLWKRVLGPHTPFFPVRYAGREAAVLAFDTRHQELVCLKLAGGQLLWRQGFPQGIREPLLMEGRWLVPGRDGVLTRIDAETGRITARLQLSQPLLGPPVRLGNRPQLVVAGEAALIYAISLQPFAVTSITFTGHAREAVTAPLLSLGRLVLLCDNERPDAAQLRVFDAQQPDQPLPEIATLPVTGTVRDAPVLRGSQLVVPVSGHRLLAYSVTDAPGQPPLNRSGDYQIPGNYSGPQQVTIGPDNRFWLQSAVFRRFELKPDGIRLDEAATAPGISAQPLQLVDEQYFLGRRAGFSRAVIFSPADRDSMTVPWKLVAGAGLLSLTASPQGGLVAVTEHGGLFSLSPNRLAQSGFETRPAFDLDLPVGLNEPIGAGSLPDGRIAVWCGGTDPQTWLCNRGGTLDFTWKHEKPLQTAPLPFQQGYLCPVAGRLRWQPGKGVTSKIDDWVAPLDKQAEWQWRALVPVNETEFLAVTGDGLVLRMQFRADPIPHLAEAGRTDIRGAIELSPRILGDKLILADTEGTVNVLEIATLDLRFRRQLPVGAARAIWPCGTGLLVHTATNALQFVRLENDLPASWEQPLGDWEPVGQPFLQGESFWLAGRDGRVLRRGLAKGELQGTRQFPQRLAALMVIGEQAYVVAVDGTIFPWEATP